MECGQHIGVDDHKWGQSDQIHQEVQRWDPWPASYGGHNGHGGDAQPVSGTFRSSECVHMLRCVCELKVCVRV